MTRCALPKTPKRRVSPDSAWPLKTAQGETFAERKLREGRQALHIASQLV